MSKIHALLHPNGDLWCPATKAGAVATTDIDKVTCAFCLYQMHNGNSVDEKKAHKRAIELSGGILHAPNGQNINKTWCGNGAVGCRQWYETTCLDCLDEGIKEGHGAPPKARAAELRAGQVAVARYPNKCPKCSAPAYVGFTMIECSKGCK